MRNVAMEEQAIEMLVENAAVNEVEASFDEIMNPKDQ